MKNNLPIEKQVCTLDQAKELDELIGDDAPESLWIYKYNKIEGKWRLILRCFLADIDGSERINAYNGDELDILLLPHSHGSIEITRHYANGSWRGYYCKIAGYIGDIYPTPAQAKAGAAIRGLQAENPRGWIKREDFKYDT